MEPESRGLRVRFRDWRHHRSRSRTPAASQNERASDQPPSAGAFCQVTGLDHEGSTGSKTAIRTTAPGQQTAECTTGIPKQNARASSEEHQEDKNDSPEVRPKINVPEPDRSNPCGSDFGSIDEERSALWKQAYEELREGNPSLVEEYELVLKEQAGVPHHGSMQEQMHEISKTQQLKCENKQWSFQWLGHPHSVRDTAERVLSLTSRASSLVSIGMNYAPPYVSVPWSAVAALIPLMMNDLKEHKGCVAGLEIVVRMTFSYQMAEQTFLGSAETRDRYRQSVIGLYRKILEYEALAMQYFGRSTLRRLGKNVAGSTRWADMPTELSAIDDDTRRSLLFLGQLSLSKMLARQESAISKLVQDAAANKEKAVQIATWVSSISVELDHRLVRDNLGPDHHSSGDWLLRDMRVRAWRDWDWDESDQCLWLRGGVGTGKSSLVSILIQDLIGSGKGCVAFFYCSKKSDKMNEGSTARNDYGNVLRSLVSQVSISLDSTDVYEGVRKPFALDSRGMLAGVGLTAEDCKEMLSDIFWSYDQSFTLVIDALDECSDYDALLDALRGATSGKRNVRLFFSSRFQVKFQDYFETSIRVDIGGSNTEDIKSFLHIEIPKRRAGSDMTDSQAQRLMHILVTRANGMFKWVELQLNLFLDKNRSKRVNLIADIETRLLSLESSEAIGEDRLLETYDQIYKFAVGDEQHRRREIVTTALRWVLCAFRTLTLRELAYATSIRPDGTIAKDINEDRVLDFCSNFLVEDAIGNIRLAHLSVRHYLEAREPPEFHAQLTHLEAALTCLYFANSPKYHEIIDNDTDATKHGDFSYTQSFHRYVQANWPRHCREAKRSAEMNELMGRFWHRLTAQRQASTLDESETSSVAGLSLEDVPRRPTLNDDVSRSFINLLPRDKDSAVWVIENFVAQGGDLQARNELGNSLLHEAVRFRITEVVRLLINVGAPLEARDSFGNTPLHLTALHRFDYGARLLLQARADKNARNSKGEAPLHIAISLSVPEVIDTLLSANADGVAKDHFKDTPFHRAAAIGNSIVTESLISMGFSPNDRNQSGHTPLSLAIQMHYPKVAKVLLEHGALSTDDDLAKLDLRGWKWTQVNNEVHHGSDKNDNRYNYSAEFPNGSRPCDRCDITRWLTGSKLGISYRHHSSIQELFASAKNGCPLCEVFCRQLPHSEGIPQSGDATEQLTVSMEPSHTQGSRHDRGDRLLLSAGDIQLLKLELCLSQSYQWSPDNSTSSYNRAMPELEWICGRQVEEKPLDSSSLTKIKEWIRKCRNEHHVCLRDSLARVLPTRLLDVGVGEDSIVRLHHTAKCLSETGDIQQYVYLSWTWGSRPPETKTDRASLASFMAGIPIDSMSKVHQDAIFTTRRLGLRYLWIDALCIIQDDRYDWQHEATLMESYITSAAFVLQAAVSPGADYGLYQPRQQPLLDIAIIRTRDSEDAGLDHEANISTSVALRLPLQTASEALGARTMKRGWMFMEVVLPRRILIFGADQIYWHCRTGLMSEGDTLTHEPMLQLLPASSVSTASERRDSLHSWYDLLSKFSASQHTFKSDRLVSVAPLGRFFDASDTLVYGLWKRDMQSGLLWRVDDIRTASLPESNRPWDDAGPSWSWSSMDDPVQYDLLGGARHDLVPAGQFSITVLPGSSDAPEALDECDGLFSGSCIELESMVCEADITRLEKSCVCFFDNIQWDINWRDSKKFLFVLVCPWTANPGGELNQACGLGLIVRPLENLEEGLFARCGLFLGTAYDSELAGWTKQRLKIV